MKVKKIEVNKLSNKYVAYEWDLLANKRDKIISEKKDISFLNVTMPYILSRIKGRINGTVLDCGCGTGYLSNKIARLTENKVIGIDISKKSVDIAEKKYADVNNLFFFNRSIEDFSKEYRKKISLCVANMVLMDILKLKECLNCLNSILVKDANFFITITNPVFWPVYWGYKNKDWFSYNSEIAVHIAPDDKTKFPWKSTHFHRPVHLYLEMLYEAGFSIQDVKELYPQKIDLLLQHRYTYPRFLGIECKKYKDIY